MWSNNYIKSVMEIKQYCISMEELYPVNDQYAPSYRNQSIDLQCKSTDWFLYDWEHWLLMEYIAGNKN